MYIRTTSRKNKDGATATYVQLAHNFWDKEAGYPRAKVLYNFGREEYVDKAALKRLVDSINRYLGPEEALKSEGGPLPFISSRPMGGAWVLEKLWSKLGIKAVLEKLLQERKFDTPVERAILAMVANRALAPKSKLATEKWVKDEVYLQALPEVGVQHLYRAMDFLLEHSCKP